MVRSATAITYELDDIPSATAELLAQIRQKPLPGAQRVALLHAQPDMEIGDLAERLSEALGCPVLGGTTAGGAVLDSGGCHELGVILHLLASDDCWFGVAISEPLNEAPERYIEDTYRSARDDLRRQGVEAEPRMLMCITCFLQNYSSDSSLDTLSHVSGGLPAFGFVAADDFELCKQQAFLNGVSGGDRMVVLLIAGDVRPVFQIKNLMGSRTFSKRKVTKANNNVICEIDGAPAYEYLREFPFIDDETKLLWNYQFFVEMEEGPDSDGVPLSRALNSYNKETGEVFCFADVPQNSYIGLQYCNDQDVKASSESALQELNAKLEQADTQGYAYSTVFVISCSLRLMFLADQKDAEGRLIHRHISPSLTVSGLYGYGEIAPTSMRGDKAVNRFHNATMTICAI